MKLKRILALVVSLAMVLAIVPSFGITASAKTSYGEGADSVSIEFVLKDIGSGFRDIAITDAKGNVITGFCLAAANDGFFPFNGERGFNESGNDGENSPFKVGGNKRTTPKGANSWYTTEAPTVKVAIESTGENTYSVTYSSESVNTPFNVKADYEGEFSGIATPDKWLYGGAGGSLRADITGNNIYNYLTDVRINVGDEESTASVQGYTPAVVAHSGGASNADTKGMLVAVGGASLVENRYGGKEGAPNIAGTTTNAKGAGLQTSRIGYISFNTNPALEEDEEIVSAIMQLYVSDVNSNLNSQTSNNWMKLAAYRTTGTLSSDTIGNANAENYKAVNEDYSYYAAYWSNETIKQNEFGWKTIDVTKALKDAMAETDSDNVTLAFRLQVPTGGVNIHVAKSNKTLQPTLIVTKAKKRKVTVHYEYEDFSKDVVLSGAIGTTVTATEHSFEHNGHIYDFPADFIVGDEDIEIEVAPFAIDNLVAHYDFADGTADDCAVGNLNGMVEGTKGVAFNENGYAIFPGFENNTNQGYIKLPADTIKNLTGNFTVSMWVNQVPNYDRDSKSITFWEFSKTHSTGNEYDRFFWQQKAGGIEIQNRENPSRSLSTGTSSEMKDKWALLTAVFDLDKGEVKAYINGKDLEVETKTYYPWSTYAAPANIYSRANGDPFVSLGHNAWNNGDNPEMKGSIADVRIYNKALDADEVAELTKVHKVIKVKYVDENGNELKDAVTLDYFLDKATFEVDDSITKDGVAYELDGDETTIQASGPEYSVKYKKLAAVPEDVKFDVITRVGIKPDIPARVDAKAADGTPFFGLEVVWDKPEDLEKAPANKIDYDVTGTLKAYPEVTVTVHVIVKTPEDYLVAYYDFESNGKNLAETGDKYDAEVGSNLSYTEGAVGNAVDFSAITGSGYVKEDAVTIGGNLLSDDQFESKAITISAYVYKNSANPAQGRIYDFGNALDGTDLFCSTRGWGSEFEFKLQGNDTVVGREIPAGEWHHIANTLELNKEGKWTAVVYYDGKEIKRGTVNGDFTAIAAEAVGATYYIGASHWGDSKFSGKIDEFKIYSVALTPEEIVDIEKISASPVVVNYVDTNGETVKEVVNDDNALFVDGNYIYSNEIEEFVKIDNDYYKVPKTYKRVEKAENDAATKVDIEIIKYVKLESGFNYAINGDFSGDTTGWKTMKGITFSNTAQKDSNDKKVRVEGGKLLTTGTVHEGSGSNYTTSIEARWPIVPGKVYIASVEMTATKNSTSQYAWFATFSDVSTSGANDRTGWIADRVANDGVTGHIDGLKQNQAVTREFLIPTTENDAAIGFQTCYFDDARVTYDNFTLYEMVPADTKIVEITLSDPDSKETVMTLSEAVGNVIPERTFLANGKIYKIKETVVGETTTNIDLEIVKPYALKKLTVGSNDTTWDGYHLAAADKAEANRITDDDGESITTDGEWDGYASKRTLKATFEKPHLEKGEIAVLYVTIGASRRNKSSDNTSVSRLKVSANNEYAFTTGHEETVNGATMTEPDTLAVDITSLVNATEADEIEILIEANGSIGVIDEHQAGINGVNMGVASYIEVKKGVEVTVKDAVEGALITKNGTKMSGTTFTASEGDTVRVYRGADSASGLATVEVTEGDSKVADKITTIGTEAVTISVITPLGITMINGAQVRIGVAESEDGVVIKSDSGLRFIGQIDEKEIGSYAQKYLAEDENIEIGVRIYADELPKSGEEDSKAHVDVPIKVWQDKDAGLFTVALTGLYDYNYNRVFYAVPYAKIGEEGSKKIILETDEEKIVARSIYEVAAGSLIYGPVDSGEDGYELSETTYAILNAYVNSVGVRFRWEFGNEEGTSAGAVDNKDGSYYFYGKEYEDVSKKPVFFEVGDELIDGKHLITITPKTNVVLDPEAFFKSMRINNNNSVAVKCITPAKTADDENINYMFKGDGLEGKGITYNKTDGTISFYFAPPSA